MWIVHPCPLPSTIRSRQLADSGLQLDYNNTSCISYAVQCRKLVPCSFNTFWTILHMYHISPSDGSVSRYTLRLEIYRATSVNEIRKKQTEAVRIKSFTSRVTKFWILNFIILVMNENFEKKLRKFYRNWGILILEDIQKILQIYSQRFRNTGKIFSERKLNVKFVVLIGTWKNFLKKFVKASEKILEKFKQYFKNILRMIFKVEYSFTGT